MSSILSLASLIAMRSILLSLSLIPVYFLIVVFVGVSFIFAFCGIVLVVPLFGFWVVPCLTSEAAVYTLFDLGVEVVPCLTGRTAVYTLFNLGAEVDLDV